MIIFRLTGELGIFTRKTCESMGQVGKSDLRFLFTVEFAENRGDFILRNRMMKEIARIIHQPG